MQIQNDYEYKMLEAFINKPEKTQWYKNAFEQFNVNGIDTMKWVWSWWAFGAGWAFLLYRKQYLPALVLFVVTMISASIPFAGIILMILSGGYATYFVYQGYQKQKAQIEAKIDDEAQRIETMRAVGGYNSWVVWLYIFINLLVFGYALFMLSAVLMN